MSSRRVICEKMSTREPRWCSRGSNLSSSTILPAGSKPGAEPTMQCSGRRLLGLLLQSWYRSWSSVYAAQHVSRGEHFPHASLDT